MPLFVITITTTDTTPELLIASSYVRDLNIYLDLIWQRYFADVPRANDVQIAYCRPWKSRLGLIRMSLDNAISFIGINMLLKHKDVPEDVLVATIAHELVHYAHGFGSPLPRLYEHPHANNVVDKELERRNLGEQLRICNEWIDEQWYSFYQAQREAGCIPGMRRPVRGPGSRQQRAG